MNAEVISSAITAVGTLVLAVATFVSTRSANHAARVAERSLLIGLRPVLVNGRHDDPLQKVGFRDDRYLRVEGSLAAVEIDAGDIYLAIPVRNVGSGIAVLQAWDPLPERATGDDQHNRDPKLFRRLTRDIYVAPGDIGFWQGALREPSEPIFDSIAAAATARRPFMVDVLYTDMHGGQRTVTRFSLTPAGDDRWLSSVSRHWILDGVSPR
jgi:hypothetical protein